MTKLIVDPEMLARLHQLRERTEFCDSTGRVLGHYVPEADVDVPISEEEIREAEEQEEKYTTAEVLAYLERL